MLKRKAEELMPLRTQTLQICEVLELYGSSKLRSTQR
jgi:hypothetical protein